MVKAVFLFYRVKTFLGLTRGVVEKRITYPHTPAHTQVQPYPAVVDERVLKATSSPKRTGDTALRICWTSKIVEKAK